MDRATFARLLREQYGVDEADAEHAARRSAGLVAGELAEQIRANLDRGSANGRAVLDAIAGPGDSDHARAVRLKRPFHVLSAADDDFVVLNGWPAELPNPIRLVLPWSHLISDNAKYAPARDRKGNPRIILRAPYREAKAAAKRKAHEAMGAVAPLRCPLRLYARVWVPDRRAGHDVPNFAKCCHDAFEKVIYMKDDWLYDARWRRMGIDVDRPRAEIEIGPSHPSQD